MECMVKAVFIQSSHSIYNDTPGEAYHFPKRNYLSSVVKTVGDWVIFYEGRAGGNRGYYAVQKVERIIDDPADPAKAYAILDRASELSFEMNVPRLRSDRSPYETGLPLSRGKNTSSVRIISEGDFASIIEAAFARRQDAESLPRDGSVSFEIEGMAEPIEPFQHLARELIVSRRAFRDASFARQVKRAYNGVCAISGLELRNGGGRSEVEAAHILPVEKSGPDTIRNGLALSRTLHWLFDRGLISVEENLDIIIAKGSLAERAEERLISPERRLLVPMKAEFQPHPAYLKWHREHVFIG
jgi:putative restriction endonuclease